MLWAIAPKHHIYCLKIIITCLQGVIRIIKFNKFFTQMCSQARIREARSSEGSGFTTRVYTGLMVV